MASPIERLKDIFENTLDGGLKFDGDVNSLDYYTLFCKAAAKDKVYKLKGNNLCMFNCDYKNKDAVLMIFYIPINTEDTGAKNVAERVMEIVECVETCFVTLDLLNSEEVKEDKFIYVTAIKILKNGDKQ